MQRYLRTLRGEGVLLLLLLAGPAQLPAGVSANRVRGWNKRGVAAVHRNSARPLWTYWGDSREPDFIQLCMETLKSHAGDVWDLHVITPASVRRYVSTEDLPGSFDVMPPSFQADAVRLALLRRHGGAWFDATAVAARDLLEWINPEFASGRHFVGFFIDHFTRPGGTPLVASWAMAVPAAEVRMMVMWHEAYLNLWHNRTSEEDITSDSFFRGADLCCVDPLQRDYLHIELVLLTLLQRDPSLRHELDDHATLWKAEDTAYAVQATLGLPWMVNHKCAPISLPISAFPANLQAALKSTPLVKFRHQDRSWLMGMPRSQLLSYPDSLVGALFSHGLGGRLQQDMSESVAGSNRSKSAESTGKIIPCDDDTW